MTDVVSPSWPGAKGSWRMPRSWYPRPMRTWVLLVLFAGCNTAPSPAESSKPPAGSPATEADSPIRALVCSQGDKRLGTLRFPKDGAPVLTVDAQGPDGDTFKVNWEKLLAMGQIKVKFHEDRDTERPLVGIVAAPGEPGYPRAVQIKMAEEYRYNCEVDPAAK